MELFLTRVFASVPLVKPRGPGISLSLLRNIGLDLAFFFPDWKAVTYDFVLLFLPFFSLFLFIYLFILPPPRPRGVRGVLVTGISLGSIT